MEEPTNLFSKKNIITFLLLGILVLAIPVGVGLVQQQQNIKSKASSEPITFSGEGVACDASGNCTTSSDEIEIELRPPEW